MPALALRARQSLNPRWLVNKALRVSLSVYFLFP